MYLHNVRSENKITYIILSGKNICKVMITIENKSEIQIHIQADGLKNSYISKKLAFRAVLFSPESDI